MDGCPVFLGVAGRNRRRPICTAHWVVCGMPLNATRGVACLIPPFSMVGLVALDPPYFLLATPYGRTLIKSVVSCPLRL